MKDTILERRFRKGADMAKHEVEVSPRALARVAGVLYLITIVVGSFNEAFVKGRIVVPLARSSQSYVNGFWSSPSNREKGNAHQTNALSPPIAYCQPIMCLTERHTQI
jgi:hypothetical protein